MKKQDEFFHELCIQYTNELYFYVSSIFKNEDTIEDIMKDIFYEVYSNISELMKLNHTNIRAKLYIYARNHIIAKTPDGEL